MRGPLSCPGATVAIPTGTVDCPKTGAQEVGSMLGIASWAPVVSGTAALGAVLLVEIAYQRRSAKRLRCAAGALAVLSVLGLVAAALGW